MCAWAKDGKVASLGARLGGRRRALVIGGDCNLGGRGRCKKLAGDRRVSHRHARRASLGALGASRSSPGGGTCLDPHARAYVTRTCVCVCASMHPCAHLHVCVYKYTDLSVCLGLHIVVKV